MQYHIVILFSIVFYLSGNVGKVTLNLPMHLLPLLFYGYSTFIIFFYKRTLAKSDWYSLMIIASALLWFAFRTILGPEAETRVIFILSLPALFVLILPKGQDSFLQYLETKNILHKFLLFFFLSECGIAIIEFIMRQHVFGWIGSSYFKGLVLYSKNDFRSVALLDGGPLNNALAVTTINLFYLFSNAFSLKNKIMLFLLGLAAIFCFNARMAIAINMIGLFLFVGKEMWHGRQSNKMRYIGFMFVAIIVFFCFLAYGMGNRLLLLKGLSEDGSIWTRLRLFKYIADAPLSDLFWGHSRSWMDHNMGVHIKVKVIENFWILFIYHLGIFIALYFTVCYLKLCKMLYVQYPKFNMIVTSLLFILLASSNNSLYSFYMPLAIFLLCIYTYQPAVSVQTIKRFFQ